MARTTVDRAYAELKRRIVGGDYAQGTHLKEEALAEDLGVSRTPVREALRRLSAEGLVVFVQNQGVRVASWGTDDVVQTYEIRALLESKAAELAATELSLGDLARLRELDQEMRRQWRLSGKDAIDRIAELNGEFHRTIVAAAGNDKLERTLAGLVEMPLVLRTFNRYADEDVQRSMNHHSELIAAFGKRDGEWAAAVMKSHVIAARHVIRESLNNDASRRTA